MSDKKHKGDHKNKQNPTSFYHTLLLKLFKKLKPKGSSFGESVSELIKEYDIYEPINHEEREILRNFIAFKDRKAYEVMLPRTFIVGIDVQATFDELKEKFITEGHTRIPVFKESLDEIIGFVHVKDFTAFIGKEQDFKIEKALRDLIYAPRSMKIIDLLTKMRQARIHIAIILDEYGGTEGLVTIEDLVEEIIGDIKDEHDDYEDPELVKVDGETIIIDGKAKIEDIEERFGVALSEDEDDFETFGGFLLAYLGKIPEVGEKFEHPSGLLVEILDADKRKINKAKITLRSPQ